MVRMRVPPIPAIEDDDLLQAVSALTRAACVMRALFLHVAEGESPVELLQQHDDVATLAEAVIEKWREHLGINFKDALINQLTPVPWRKGSPYRPNPLHGFSARSNHPLVCRHHHLPAERTLSEAGAVPPCAAPSLIPSQEREVDGSANYAKLTEMPIMRS